jgi:predicted nucleic acid-binding protein
VILLDTSGILAALFADQRHHEECARALREATPPRIISPFVLAEADYLIQKYGGIKAEMLFLEDVADGAYQIAPFDDRDDLEFARQVISNYEKLGIGLADASIVVLAHRYDCRDVLTLDHRHFRTLRPSGRKRFRILPADL